MDFFKSELGLDVFSLTLERGKLIVNGTEEILVSESLYEYIKLALL